MTFCLCSASREPPGRRRAAAGEDRAEGCALFGVAVLGFILGAGLELAVGIPRGRLGYVCLGVGWAMYAWDSGGMKPCALCRKYAVWTEAQWQAGCRAWSWARWATSGQMRKWSISLCSSKGWPPTGILPSITALLSMPVAQQVPLAVLALSVSSRSPSP